MLVFSRMKTEYELIIGRFRSLAAYRSCQEWSCMGYPAEEMLLKRIEAFPYPEVCCLDITGGTGTAEKVRENGADSLIVLIADRSVSPVSYIKPTIMAAGIVLRPADIQQTDRMFSDIFAALDDRERSAAFGGEVFSLEVKDGILKVPYSDILFFEAREKKIFLSTKAFEQGFYSTLDSLEQSLPDGFRRCHKSFIVNLRAIAKTSFTENLLTLSGGASIPVSRSYKAAVKEALR